MKVLNLPSIEAHKIVRKSKTIYTEEELKSMESFFKPKNITVKPKKNSLKNKRCKSHNDYEENQVNL